jgi:uncharacterized protein (DUF2141 family)
MKSLAAVVIASALWAGQSAQTPVRDLHKEPVGAGSISGMVQTDEASPRALRRAVVTLAGDRLLTGRQVVTGDEGRFEFTDLPAGQYTLQAYKSNYMRTSYGAKRPGGSGTSIVLGDGQKLKEILIKLPRYAVISGTIYDQHGEPAQGISVEVMSFTMRTGQRSLSSVYGRPQTTDDRGVYRAGGLAPGEYFVAAGPSSDNGTSELQVLSASEIDRALQTGTPGASGAPAGAPSATTSTRVGLAPVFFPGASDLAGATKITLTVGEERAGVDFALHVAPTARIDGTVTGPDGQPATNVQVVATYVTEAYSLDLFRGTLGSARPDAQGKFSYAGLSPGRYVITARSVPGAPASSTPSTPSTPTTGPLWAMADVTVNGVDQSVGLMLQPGVTVSGKVVFDGMTLQPPASMTTMRVSMPAMQTSSVAIGVTPASVNADGTFVIAGAAPGTYKLTSTPPTAPAGWMLRSAIVNGVDSLDVPFEIKPNQPIAGAVVTFTDHPTELSGMLQTPAGVPTSNYFIIVFATNKAFWTPASRRVVMARPATTGTYTIRNLPPGEYLVAAVTDVEFNAWFDPAFLEQLVAASTRVTLAESDKKTLDLRIGGGHK